MISGTLRKVTGASLSSVAQSTGSTAFLLAEGSIRPVSFATAAHEKCTSFAATPPKTT